MAPDRMLARSQADTGRSPVAVAQGAELPALALAPAPAPALALAPTPNGQRCR